MPHLKRILSYQWFFLLILLVLTACSNGATSQDMDIPAPEAGKATLAGRIVSPDGKPLADTPVRLANVHREGDRGAYILDLARSPGNFSDANGYFVIPNIEAAEYTIVVGDPETLYTVIANKDGSATTWTPKAGQVLDVGTLKVELKPVD